MSVKADSDRLIALDHGARGLNMESGIPTSLGLYYQYRERVPMLVGVALHRPERSDADGFRRARASARGARNPTLATRRVSGRC